VTELLADADAVAAASAVALQWQTEALIPLIQERTSLPIIQSQHVADNAPWETPHQSERAPNDHPAAMAFWSTMYGWIDLGVNAYHVWHLVLDTVGLGLGTLTPWPKNALLTVDRASATLVVTPSYYVFRHVAGFVEPDARRLEVTSEGLDALGFENPDGEVIVVLHNREAAARAAVVGIDETSLDVEVPARGWLTVAWPP
jgi:glucosylceramidase